MENMSKLRGDIGLLESCVRRHCCVTPQIRWQLCGASGTVFSLAMPTVPPLATGSASGAKLKDLDISRRLEEHTTVYGILCTALIAVQGVVLPRTVAKSAARFGTARTLPPEPALKPHSTQRCRHFVPEKLAYDNEYHRESRSRYLSRISLVLRGGWPALQLGVSHVITSTATSPGEEFTPNNVNRHHRCLKYACS
jgi:hypothetical protein